MEKDKISIVIPVFGVGDKLERCIESVFEQKYKNYEIVLVDDGSYDSSSLVCDYLCAKYENIIVVHKKNAGPSSARNIGIEQANGEYFVCIDGDDIVYPDYLSDFNALKNAHPELGHFWCGFERDSENGKEYVCSKTEEISYKNRGDYQELSAKILAQSPCFHLFNTNIVKSNHIKMNENISLGEDVVFNLEYLDACQKTGIGIINKANYVYLDTNDASLNNKYRADLSDVYEFIDNKVEMYLDKWGISDKSGFYNGVICHYLQLFENTFNEKCLLCKKEKIAYNSKLMKQKRFQTALRKSTAYMNPILKRLYMSGNYNAVILFDKLVHIRNRIKA